LGKEHLIAGQSLTGSALCTKAMCERNKRREGTKNKINKITQQTADTVAAIEIKMARIWGTK
jgi:hypothetical protein